MRICQIPGCSLEIPPTHWMCAAHWFEVPAALRGRVTQSFSEWKNGLQDVRAYLTARFTAIVFVAKLHGIDVTEEELKLGRWKAAV
jgi:hypothetical protein